MSNIFVNYALVVAQPKEGKKPGIMVQYMDLDSPEEGKATGFQAVQEWLEGLEFVQKFKGVGFYQGSYRTAVFGGRKTLKLSNLEFVQTGTFAPVK